jgi:hypothetical protein
MNKLYFYKEPYFIFIDKDYLLVSKQDGQLLVVPYINVDLVNKCVKYENEIIDISSIDFDEHTVDYINYRKKKNYVSNHVETLYFSFFSIEYIVVFQNSLTYIEIIFGEDCVYDVKYHIYRIDNVIFGENYISTDSGTIEITGGNNLTKYHKIIKVLNPVVRDKIFFYK